MESKTVKYDDVIVDQENIPADVSSLAQRKLTAFQEAGWTDTQITGIGANAGIDQSSKELVVESHWTVYFQAEINNIAFLKSGKARDRAFCVSLDNRPIRREEVSLFPEPLHKALCQAIDIESITDFLRSHTHDSEGRLESETPGMSLDRLKIVNRYSHWRECFIYNYQQGIPDKDNPFCISFLCFLKDHEKWSIAGLLNEYEPEIFYKRIWKDMHELQNAYRKYLEKYTGPGAAEDPQQLERMSPPKIVKTWAEIGKAIGGVSDRTAQRRWKEGKLEVYFDEWKHPFCYQSEIERFLTPPHPLK